MAQVSGLPHHDYHRPPCRTGPPFLPLPIILDGGLRPLLVSLSRTRDLRSCSGAEPYLPLIHFEFKSQ
jgi:hypothetical protein